MSPADEAASPHRGSLIAGLPAGLAAAFLVAVAIPAIAVAVTPGYTFSARDYFEVFIHRHHNVLTWFERGWPDCVMPFVVILAPLMGGMVLHLLWRRKIYWTAGVFAISYSIIALAAAALAESSHPYAFHWSECFDFQGARQMLTLFALAGVMSAAGAWVAGWFARRRRRA